MSTAYILAEQRIINDAAHGIDTTGHIAAQSHFVIEDTPESFHFEVGRPMNDKELLYNKAQEVRKQLENAIENEDYEKAQLLQHTLDVIERKYNKL